MKIKIKKTLKEMSAMSTGAVAGHVDSRKKQELEEISQSSGLTGHNIFPKATAEEEHEGHVERSRHQGLRNVTETIKGNKKMKIIIKRKMKEHFYSAKDLDKDATAAQIDLMLTKEKALTNDLASFIAKNIKANVGSIKIGEIQASGAEGIVTSISDSHVVKMFFGLDNAIKNYPLIGKDYNFTPNVVEGGTIVFKGDERIIYSKFRSTKSKPSPAMYYIVMERIKPDPKIYRSIEDPWNRLNLLPNTNFFDTKKASLVALYQACDSDYVRQQLDKIYLEFLENSGIKTDPNMAKLVAKHGSIEDFLQLPKRPKNKINAKFGNWKKTQKGRRVLLHPKSGGPLLLKHIILSIAAGWNNVPGDQQIIDYLMSSGDYKKTVRISELRGQSAGQVLGQVLNLVKEIWDKKIPFLDVHQEQFGFKQVNGKPVLAAMDLGAKVGDDKQKWDPSIYFMKNTLQYSLDQGKGSTAKVFSRIAGDEEYMSKVRDSGKKMQEVKKRKKMIRIRKKL